MGLGVGSWFQEEVRDPVRNETGIDIAGLGLGGITGGVIGEDAIGDFYEDLTGKSAERAARDAARVQEAAGQRAITVADEAQRRLEEQLAPFIQALGLDLIPQVQNLFGANAGESLVQDPALQALLNETQRRIQAGQSATGRPTGETNAMLQDAFLRTGTDLLSRQRGDLLSALGIGQSSAAQTGVSGINTAGRTGDLLTQIANSQAAGMVGGAQARAQGTGQMLGTGLNLLGMFLGASDRRLKRNITKIGKHNGHNVYQYQYKHSDDWHIGVMAQEVQEVNPDAVLEFNGYLMVNYGAL